MGPEKEADLRPPTRPVGVKVTGPARETTLQGVFASNALETVYLIQCGEKSVVVDTGYDHNTDAHLDAFAEFGLDLGSVAAILATHFHVDHTAGLARAKERLGVPVVAHKNNVDVIESGDLVITAARMPYIPGWDFDFPPCKIDEVIEEGDTITVGDTEFQIDHIPGHTPGCTAYTFGDDWMITGDVVFPNGMIGWNDVHWGSNYFDFIETMKKMGRLNPNACLPTHGLPFPYDPAWADMGVERAEKAMENGAIGAMAHTERAPLADPDRKPRRIVL